MHCASTKAVVLLTMRNASPRATCPVRPALPAIWRKAAEAIGSRFPLRQPRTITRCAGRFTPVASVDVHTMMGSTPSRPRKARSISIRCACGMSAWWHPTPCITLLSSLSPMPARSRRSHRDWRFLCSSREGSSCVRRASAMWFVQELHHFFVLQKMRTLPGTRVASASAASASSAAARRFAAG